jgi:hypothetical protein
LRLISRIQDNAYSNFDSSGYSGEINWEIQVQEGEAATISEGGIVNFGSGGGNYIIKAISDIIIEGENVTFQMNLTVVEILDINGPDGFCVGGEAMYQVVTKPAGNYDVLTLYNSSNNEATWVPTSGLITVVSEVGSEVGNGDFVRMKFGEHHKDKSVIAVNGTYLIETNTTPVGWYDPDDQRVLEFIDAWVGFEAPKSQINRFMQTYHKCCDDLGLTDWTLIADAVSKNASISVESTPQVKNLPLSKVKAGFIALGLDVSLIDDIIGFLDSTLPEIGVIECNYSASFWDPHVRFGACECDGEVYSTWDGSEKYELSGAVGQWDPGETYPESWPGSAPNFMINMFEIEANYTKSTLIFEGVAKVREQFSARAFSIYRIGDRAPVREDWFEVNSPATVLSETEFCSRVSGYKSLNSNWLKFDI